jgi:serine-type D-Ala-D-Ala carboxypeptidase (penicillin-binding protein 5/6)
METLARLVQVLGAGRGEHALKTLCKDVNEECIDRYYGRRRQSARRLDETDVSMTTAFLSTRWRAVAIGLIAGLALSAVNVTVHAQGVQQANTGEYTTRAKHAIVMDAASGAVLYQYRADETFAPASMNKLMTLAVVFRALKTGQIKLEDQFLMSENAWRRGGAPSRTSAMMVPLNTRTKLDDLLQGIIVQSGNDAAIAVAEAMAGSEAGFAKLMSDEARRIGLKRSVFRNATGLSNSEQVVTARDLAILSRYLIQEYPDMYGRFAQKEFTYSKHRFINRNTLLSAGIGADGLKTGHLSESGYGLVGSAVQDGKRVIAVVAGLATDGDRKEESRKIIEWGFKNFAEFKVFDAGEIVGHARVWGGDKLYVALKGKGDLSVVLPRFPANQKLKGEIIYQGPLKPPVKEGDQIAMLRVTSSSGASNDVPLFAAEDAVTAGLVRKGLDSLAHLAEQAVSMAFTRVKAQTISSTAPTAAPAAQPAQSSP